MRKQVWIYVPVVLSAPVIWYGDYFFDPNPERYLARLLSGPQVGLGLFLLVLLFCVAMVALHRIHSGGQTAASEGDGRPLSLQLLMSSLIFVAILECGVMIVFLGALSIKLEASWLLDTVGSIFVVVLFLVCAIRILRRRLQ